jgi:hypothetical protein
MPTSSSQDSLKFPSHALHPRHPQMVEYLAFLEFVHEDMKREREVSNRRMGMVLLWCFIVPAVVSLIALMLVRFGLVDRSAILVYEWSMVAFPMGYLLYTLFKDFVMDLGGQARRGALWQTLNRFAHEAGWQISIAKRLRSTVSTDSGNWKWIASQYGMDLKRMRTRSNHLTILASSVFFIIMNGLDWIATERDFWSPGFFQPDWMQVVGLSVFLILLTLSSSQVAFALDRYRCVARMLGDHPWSEEGAESDLVQSTRSTRTTSSA